MDAGKLPQKAAGSGQIVWEREDGAVELSDARQRDLAACGREARQRLIESVDRERLFQHMDAKGGACANLREQFEKVAEEYDSGEFFARELGLFFEVAPTLSLTLLHLRQRWIEEYHMKSVQEMMLVDMTLMSYFQAVRANREAAKLLSLMEESLFREEEPAERFDVKLDLAKAEEDMKEELDVEELTDEQKRDTRPAP